MNNATEDPAIRRFYDALFEQASRIVRAGKEHAPIIVLLHSSGATRAMLTADLSSEERASLFLGFAKDPQVHGAALIMETWYADETDIAANPSLLQMVQQGKLCEYPGRKEAIVISIVTATRQAIMMCPIDRATNSVHKMPLQWLNEQSTLTYLGRYVRPPGVNCN